MLQKVKGREALEKSLLSKKHVNKFKVNVCALCSGAFSPVSLFPRHFKSEHGLRAVMRTGVPG